MPNPIILIFEYHQVPAGEILFQNNFLGLVNEGYQTYLDEEAFDVNLDKKLSASAELVKKAQSIPKESEQFWQKKIVIIRKKSIELLIQHQFDYFPFDMPEKEIQELVIKNFDILNSYPKGFAEGVNDLLSGKIPQRQEAFKKRVQFQNKEFTKQAMNAKSGVVSIAGIYHANHLQSYFNSQYPEQDILSFFPYQGEPFEEYEISARNPDTNKVIFPHNARLIDMDNGFKQINTIMRRFGDL